MWTEDNETFKSVTGTKGFKFKQSAEFKDDDVDFAYYDRVALEGLKKIMKVGDINEIVDDMPTDYQVVLGLSPEVSEETSAVA